MLPCAQADEGWAADGAAYWGNGHHADGYYAQQQQPPPEGAYAGAGGHYVDGGGSEGHGSAEGGYAIGGYGRRAVPATAAEGPRRIKDKRRKCVSCLCELVGFTD